MKKIFIPIILAIIFSGCSLSNTKEYESSEYESSTSRTYSGWVVYGSKDEKRNIVISRSVLDEKDVCIQQAKTSLTDEKLDSVFCGKDCVCEPTGIDFNSCVCDQVCKETGVCRD